MNRFRDYLDDLILMLRSDIMVRGLSKSECIRFTLVILEVSLGTNVMVELAFRLIPMTLWMEEFCVAVGGWAFVTMEGGVSLI